MSGKFNSYELGSITWHKGYGADTKMAQIYVDDVSHHVIIPAELTEYNTTLAAAKAEYLAGRTVSPKVN
jgi:hypothetical protein